MGQGLRCEGLGDSCESDLEDSLIKLDLAGSLKTGHGQGRDLVEKRTQRSLTKVWSKEESWSVRKSHTVSSL